VACFFCFFFFVFFCFSVFLLLFFCFFFFRGVFFFLFFFFFFVVVCVSFSCCLCYILCSYVFITRFLVVLSPGEMRRCLCEDVLSSVSRRVFSLPSYGAVFSSPGAVLLFCGSLLCFDAGRLCCLRPCSAEDLCDGSPQRIVVLLSHCAFKMLSVFFGPIFVIT